MEKFKKYGKGFLIAAGAVGLVLLVILVGLGLPIWLAVPIAFTGALPAALAIGALGIGAWFAADDDHHEVNHAARERYRQESESRDGQAFLDRAAQGRARKRK